MTTRRMREQQRGEKRAWRGEHRERKRLRGEYQPPSPVRQEFRTRELADCERIVTIASVSWCKPEDIRTLLELRREQLPLRGDVPQRPASGTLVVIDVRAAKRKLRLDTPRLVSNWLGQDGYRWAGKDSFKKYGEAGPKLMTAKYRRAAEDEAGMQRRQYSLGDGQDVVAVHWLAPHRQCATQVHDAYAEALGTHSQQPSVLALTFSFPFKGCTKEKFLLLPFIFFCVLVPFQGIVTEFIIISARCLLCTRCSASCNAGQSWCNRPKQDMQHVQCDMFSLRRRRRRRRG